MCVFALPCLHETFSTTYREYTLLYTQNFHAFLEFDVAKHLNRENPKVSIVNLKTGENLYMRGI